MYKEKNIIICKFYLKNKCKFGEKCKFRHLSVKELSNIAYKFEDLKQEILSLKADLKEKTRKLSNLEKKCCDVTNNNLHILAKPLYNSFFKEIHDTNGSVQIETKEMVNFKDSDIDDTDLLSFKNKFKPKIKILDNKNATQRKNIIKQQNDEIHKQISSIYPSKLIEMEQKLINMEQKLTKIEQKRVEDRTDVMNIIDNLRDNQHKMTKKFNKKIVFLNRTIQTSNIYNKYLCEELIKNPTTKEEMLMEIENQISDDEDSESTNGEKQGEF